MRLCSQGLAAAVLLVGCRASTDEDGAAAGGTSEASGLTTTLVPGEDASTAGSQGEGTASDSGGDRKSVV